MAFLVVAFVAFGATYALSLLAWHVLRHILLVKNTGTTSLHLLQQGRAEHDKIPGTAVICGGGIAGLLTARVCHEHFERVLIIEAEPWLSTDDARRVDGWKLLRHTRARLMQWNSLHASQAYLFAGLEKLFPNIIEEAARSQIKVLPSFPRLSNSGAPLRRPQPAGGLPKTMYTTRHGLETFVRRLVLDREAYPNISIKAGTVTDVVPDPANKAKLSQVVFRNEAGTVETVDAALVADCSGPARAGLKWLARHGYGTPSTPGYPNPPSTLPLDDLKIALDQKLRYSSLTYTAPDAAFMARLEALLPDDVKNDGPIITFLEDYTEATRATGRACLVVWRVDANQISVFAGHPGEVRFQPTNVEQLRQYAHSLYEIEPIAEYFWKILDLLEEIEDTAMVSLLRVPATSYVRYSRATNMPSNFVALGDSVMTVNPLFGEGCTKALRCAMALHTELLRANKTSPRSLPHTFAKDFFEEEKVKTEWLWDETRLADYGAPMTDPIPGESLSEGAALRWYITTLQRMAPYDDHASLVLYDSLIGFGSPIDAMHPHLVAKVLWRGLVMGR
ncbi:hypothetical protein HMN09_00668500 [Mycena chlorophos]|uniref:FAD/NAD(P)-binding domain-containing protein n=1 Tax=Mycena chlorophos TaxID=658473 RepID=A0A8H6W9M4_MYCCL|nr:hypothetical protein HMN09_00668500 [Mycena chlorophos]